VCGGLLLPDPGMPERGGNLGGEPPLPQDCHTLGDFPLLRHDFRLERHAYSASCDQISLTCALYMRYQCPIPYDKEGLDVFSLASLNSGYPIPYDQEGLDTFSLASLYSGYQHPPHMIRIPIEGSVNR